MNIFKIMLHIYIYIYAYIKVIKKVGLQSHSLLIFLNFCQRSQQPLESLQTAQNNASRPPFESPKPIHQQRSWCRLCHQTV